MTVSDGPGLPQPSDPGREENPWGAGSPPRRGLPPGALGRTARPWLTALNALMGGLDTGSQRQAVAEGMAAIGSRDPGFEETGFLARAEWAYHLVRAAQQGRDPGKARPAMADVLWAQCRSDIAAGGGPGLPALPAESRASIIDAHADSRSDTLTVRFSNPSGVPLDWTFQRPAGQIASVGPSHLSRCPNCGAPLTVDDNGACAYCHESLAAASTDWLLVRAQVADPSAFLAEVVATQAQRAKLTGGGRAPLSAANAAGCLILVLLAVGFAILVLASLGH